MRIAVSSQGNEITSRVDPRFGRAQYFIIYDTEKDSFEVIENLQNVNAPQGAGIQSAQNVVRKNVDIIVSGNLGPKAFAALSAAGVKAALWSEGSVLEAVEKIKSGMLKPTERANVEGHWT